MSEDDTARMDAQIKKLQSTRDALTAFLNTKNATGESGLKTCEDEKKNAAEAAEAAKNNAAEAAEAAKKKAADKAKKAAEAAKAESAEAAKTEAEAAKTTCETEKSELMKKAEKKRADEILDLQNKLIIELENETKFLNKLMGITPEDSAVDIVSTDSGADSGADSD
jgi:hypothetical protein